MSAPTDTSSRDAVRRVLRNPGLRRIQLAFFGSLLGDWAYATAVTVWAYTEGGAAAVGAFQAVRFAAVATAGPLGAMVADRVSRKTFMIVIDAIRALLVTGAAITLMVDGPAAIIYVLGVVSAMVGAPFRSAQAGVIPRLVESPDELTASNAVAANLENVVTFLGPALGALLVGVSGVEVVFWFNVATYLWSMLMVSAVRVPQRRDGSPDVDEGEDDTDPEPAKENFLRELTAGFSFVGRDRDLRTVALLAAAQGFVWGALTVFTVVIAITMLMTGPEGVGYLDAVMGLLTVVGGAIVLTRVGKGRLGQDMATGVLGWSLPLIGLALFPHPVTAFAAVAVVGLSDPWVNVGLETIPQRLTPDRVMSRVYGAVDSALVGAMALGAALAPVMIALIGFRPSMALVGILVTAYTLTTLRRMRGLDARMSEPVALPLVRSISIFAPLPPSVQEVLARKLVTVTVPAGEAVIREGEAADRFYVIADGRVEVTQEGRVLRVEEAGDFFGEIGLLRDVPRTATVTTLTDATLWSLDRQSFLDAVSGQDETRAAAEDVVSRRLAV